jgi:GNAT superfamily N-acetyltransferase
MKVIDFDEKYIGFVSSCTHSVSNQLDSVGEERTRWIRNNLDKGLMIKIAVDEGNPLGFAHCMPIELGTWGIEGHDVMAIPCLTLSYERVYSEQKGSGIGRALVQAVEDEARKSAKGVSVLCFDHDFWFMPYSFFKKLGYQEVDRKDNAVIMLKAFTHVDPPRFTEFDHTAELVPGKVVVEAFWQSICPVSIIEIQNIKSVCAEFGERVLLHAINTTDWENRSQYPVLRTLFINGTQITFEDVGSPEAIREAIVKELDRI